MLPDLADPDAWTAFVTALAPTPSRLLTLLYTLRTSNHPAAPARAGHTLLLLKRPRLAMRLLEDRDDYLSQGQYRLAVIRRALSEDDPLLLDHVLRLDPVLGRAQSPLDREGQIRAYLAHGMALERTGRAQDAAVMLNRALAVAELEQAQYLAQNIRRSLAESAIDADERLEQFVRQLATSGNPASYQLMDAARDLRSRLMVAGRYEQIASIGTLLAPVLPDASWWPVAARSILHGKRPPELKLAPGDALMQVSHAFYHLQRAARARELLRRTEQWEHANKVVRLPATDATDRFSSDLMAIMRTVALTYSGDLSGATRHIRQIYTRLKASSSARPVMWMYLCAAAIHVLAEGGTYPDLFPPCVLLSTLQESAYTVHEQGRLPGSLTRVAALTPTALLVMAVLPGLPDDIHGMVSSGQVAVLRDAGLTVGQARHAHVGGEGGLAIRAAFAARPGELVVAPDKVAAYRHRESLKALGLPLAVAVQAQRALDHFQLHLSPRREFVQ